MSSAASAGDAEETSAETAVGKTTAEETAVKETTAAALTAATPQRRRTGFPNQWPPMPSC